MSIRFVLTPILFWCGLIGVFFLCDAYPLVNNGIAYGPTMTSLGFATFGICLTLGVYLILERKKNNVRIDWVLAPIFLILCITSIVGIWLTGSNYTWTDVRTTTIEITNNLKIIYTVESVLIFLCLYALCGVFLRTKTRNRHFAWIYLALNITMIAICIASLFTDLNLFKDIITSTKVPTEGVKGFFTNANTFGFACFVGIVACISLNWFRRRWYRYILILVYYVFGAFSLCATSIFLSTIVIVLYFIIESIAWIKKKTKLSVFLFSLTYVLLIGFIVVFSISLNTELGFFTKISNLILKFISSKDYGTFTGRMGIWKAAIAQSSSDPYHLTFGYGFRIGTLLTSQRYFASSPKVLFDQYYPLHSGYFEILLSNGIFGLVVYGTFIIYAFYCAFKVRKIKKAGYCSENILIIVACLVYSAVESFYLIDLVSTGRFLILTLLLPIQARKHMKSDEVEEKVVNQPYWSTPIERSSLTKIISCALYFVLITLGCLFINKNIYYDQLMFNVLLAGIVLTVISLFMLPYLISNFVTYGSFKRGIFRICLFLVVFLGGLSGLIFGVYSVTNSYRILMIVFPIAIIAIYLLFYLLYSRHFKISLKEQLCSTFSGIFKLSNVLPVIYILCIAMPLIIIQQNYVISDADMGAILFASLSIILLFFMVLPFKENKLMLEELNKEGLYLLKRGIIYDKSNKD